MIFLRDKIVVHMYVRIIWSSSRMPSDPKEFIATLQQIHSRFTCLSVATSGAETTEPYTAPGTHSASNIATVIVSVTWFLFGYVISQSIKLKCESTRRIAKCAVWYANGFPRRLIGYSQVITPSVAGSWISQFTLTYMSVLRIFTTVRPRSIPKLTLLK